jgi:hypothetical protein
MKKHKMDVCGLLETKMSFSKVAFMHRFWLKHWKVFSNAGAAPNARIILFWNPSTVLVDPIDSSTQGLHVRITCLISQSSFMATFVYGFNTVIVRRSLWANLHGWCPLGPWMILGGFQLYS